VAHIDRLVQAGTISAGDENLFLVTDSVEEAVAYIQKNSITKFNLQPEKPFRPFGWLLEKPLK
jgi:predicted Rossmann-fold nucleotide-binding protein